LLPREMKMKRRAFLSVASALLLAACSTTKVLNVWQDEAFQGERFSKVLVVGVLREPAYRRLFENEMVSALRSTGVGAYASYNVFPDTDKIERGAAVEQIHSLGVDAVLVTRLVDTRSETVYTPGTTYVQRDPIYRRRGWYGYYGGSYTVIHTPGYATEFNISTAETNVFEVSSEQPVWTVLTETSETSVTRAIGSYVKAIADSLRSSGLFRSGG
jgi:hypothetical protein